MSFNVFILEKPSDCPHKLYIARNSPCGRFAPLTASVKGIDKFSRNCFSKVAWLEPAKLAQKQNLTRNSHSRSLKVTHFGIIEKLTTDCISLYNNAGLISKVSEKYPVKMLKIAVVDNPIVV